MTAFAITALSLLVCGAVIYAIVSVFTHGEPRRPEPDDGDADSSPTDH